MSVWGDIHRHFTDVSPPFDRHCPDIAGGDAGDGSWFLVPGCWLRRALEQGAVRTWVTLWVQDMGDRFMVGMVS